MERANNKRKIIGLFGSIEVAIMVKARAALMTRSSARGYSLFYYCRQS